METFLTILGFAAVTAVAIALHLRGSKRREAGPARRCGGCNARVPEGRDRCPACGVPLQVYEVVGAPVASASVTAAGPSHAVVRADRCVGCGACVAVCPEPGAIRLEGKLAIVDRDLCRAHGECVKACPVGGIFLASGNAVQSVEVPLVGAGFETDVPGLFVVGELGGRGLIRNAVNEGRVAVEEVARRAKARGPAADPDVEDVIIVGSGPAGLSAGLEALRSGLRYRILERGDLSETIRRYPRHKILMAEPVQIPMYGELWVADASKETLLSIWQGIAERTGLKVDTGQEVIEVAPHPGGFLVRTAARPYAARYVVLALGRRGTPRRLGVPGEALPHVFYDIVEMEAFRGSRVLVVGGGDSAIESVTGLTVQPGTQVTLSYRGEAFDRVKERNRQKLEDARKAGRVEVLLGSQVRAIHPGGADLEIGGEVKRIAADYVVIRIGGEAPYGLLRRAGVSIVTKELSAGGAGQRAVA